jgi:glycosyltransferase involved in cell wall biosynthesis
MHVLYIHQHFNTNADAGGTRSYEMARRLISDGHQVTIISGPSSARTTTQGRVYEQHVDGIRVLRVGEPYSAKMSFWRRLEAFWRFAAAASRVSKGIDADVVFATSTPLTVGIPGMRAARRLGVPFVFEVRDRWPAAAVAMGVVHNRLVIAAAERLERRIYRRADRIVVVAPGIRDAIIALGKDPNLVTVIPNIANTDLFRPSTANSDNTGHGEPGDLRLVFTGAHGKANGLDAIVDAAHVLRDEAGIHFVLIGDGPEKGRLRRRVMEAGLDQMFTFLSPMPKSELAQLLPLFDVGMMILEDVAEFHYGTSPNKLCDYLAAGLPVLNNYPGWIAELLEANECGLAAKPGSPVAFAVAVRSLRDDRTGAAIMGRRARAVAEEVFDSDRLTGEFVQVIEDALQA